MIKYTNKLVTKFFQEEDGTTAVEYAVMLALIATAAMLAISVTATASSDIWNQAADEMDEALNE